ncbi:MAG TPA: hypothetical protein VHL78_08380 [Actinomycetota bacterium]|nr:hypothetical protein [Actinomycetota bacterium]
MIALGVLGQVLWWIALAAFFFVVVPVVIVVANRVVREARLIRDYATDVLEHGVGAAGNLDPVPELDRTRQLVKEVGAGLGRYGTAVAGLLSRRSAARNEGRTP